MELLFKYEAAGPVHSIALSPCFTFLVAGCADGVLSVHALPSWGDPEAAAALSRTTLTKEVRGRASSLATTVLSGADVGRNMVNKASEAIGEAKSMLFGMFGKRRGESKG